MKIRIGNGHLRILCVFLFVLLYTYHDLASGSTSYNFSGVSRTTSHYFLIITIASIMLFTLSARNTNTNKFGQYTGPLLLLFLWIALNCLFLGTPLWTTATYVGFILWWIFTFQMAKRFCALEDGNDKYLVMLSMLMLAFYIYQFVLTYRFANSLGNKNYAVLNIVFRVLVFLPLALLLKNRFIKNTIIVIIGIVVCASLKRAALISFPLMLISYSIVDSKVNKKSIKGVFRLLLIGGCIFAAFIIADSFFNGFISSRFTRSQLQFASGRSERWSEALSNIGSRSFISFIFGTGIGSAGYAQHNEWIEQLFSFGLLGLFFYSTFFISLIKTFIIYYKRNSQYAAPYVTLVIYFLIVGFVSGFMFMHSTFYLFIFMGIVDYREPYIISNSRPNYI